MDKILVQRANVVLRVRPDEKQRYMDNGYSVIDESGAVIERAFPKDVASLTKLCHELEAEIAKKDAEIEKLKKSSARKAKTTTED